MISVFFSIFCYKFQLLERFTFEKFLIHSGRISILKYKTTHNLCVFFRISRLFWSAADIFGALFESVEHSSLHSVSELSPADHGVQNLEDQLVRVLLLLKVVEDTVLGHLGPNGESKMD